MRNKTQPCHEPALPRVRKESDPCPLLLEHRQVWSVPHEVQCCQRLCDLVVRSKALGVALRSYPAWPRDFTPLSLWCPPRVDGLGMGTPRNAEWGVTESSEVLLCPWALQGLGTGCCGPSHCALLLKAHGPPLEFLPPATWSSLHC